MQGRIILKNRLTKKLTTEKKSILMRIISKRRMYKENATILTAYCAIKDKHFGQLTDPKERKLHIYI